MKNGYFITTLNTEDCKASELNSKHAKKKVFIKTRICFVYSGNGKELFLIGFRVREPKV